jgi:type I restriction enzyme, R subunit
MTSSNFSFLKNEWADIYDTAQKAEQYAFTEPTVSAFLCRKALEEMLSWLYDHDSSLELPTKEQFNLNDLIREPSFQKNWGKEFGRELVIIKNTGNSAAHKSVNISSNEAISSIKFLFRFCFTVARTFAETTPPAYLPFSETLVPTTGNTLSQKEIEKIRQEEASKNLVLERRVAELSEKEEELEKVKAQLAHYETLSQQNGLVAAPAVLSEKETRKLYIDVMLRQAGWDIEQANTQEFAIQSIDEATGKTATLKADYLLWGDNGKPWAVIEAKRTTAAVERGRNQGQYYADALEQIYGQRPLIYYTNGFETFLWDDKQYPPRKVFGFLSLDEMQRLLIRKTQRATLKAQKINQSIANRYYQERAIRSVAERFEEKNHRKALLVMATGTGKTRVSAAIVDLLTKAQWAKRILFLADRNALVTQALKNFNQYLPNLSGIDLTKTVDDGSARVVFSTYQTIINKIDNDYRNGKRYYGVGHFDLVVIDEAHRSIYDKYGAIFDYFDGLYLGLTATPKNETDRDTYSLFDHQQGEPTDAYEYATAIADEFLVPIKKVKLELRFPTQGIKYKDLSEEEKREWERKFYDPATGKVINEINSGAINQWLFNQDTVDKVLTLLMEFGHKVEGNEKLGKTIIFARKHKHAEFIYERFYKLYPQIDSKFAQIIDNYDKDAEKLIDQFKLKDKFPQIAISVDMLDTGIDVPEIVNLVFFKPVYSASKFWQMLGRGTRLCRDLFAPDVHKENFYVFDVCSVFDFFGQNPAGIVPGKSRSLSESIFIARAELIYLLQTQGDADPDSDDFKLAKSMAEKLHKQITDLDQTGFEVRLHLREVEHYGKIESWTTINANDIQVLSETVAGLIHDEESDEKVKRFDLMMAKMQVAILRSERSQIGYIEKLQVMASELLRKGSDVPAIAKKKTTLQALIQPEYWAEISIPAIEKVRIDIRELSKLIDLNTGKGIFYTNFQDEITAPVIAEDFVGSYGNYESHYAKLKKIIADNANNLTIHRLRTNQPITSTELDELDRILFEQSGLSTHQEFQKVLGEKPLGIFIRSILGLDTNAAREAFSAFLANSPLSSIQIEFINNLIQQFTQNGIIEPSMLFEQPFTKFHESGIGGVFPMNAEKLISIIEETNQRAMVG